MTEIYGWIVANKQLVFFGIGVFVLGLIVTFLLGRRKKSQGDSIITLGDQSPGKI